MERNGHGAAKDHKGGSKGSSTEDTPRDIDDAVRNRRAMEHGYDGNRWDTRVLQRYVHDIYGRRYSCQRIRQVPHELGFSFKRSTERPARANKQAQEAFKESLPHQWMSLPG
jgi:transposase